MSAHVRTPVILVVNARFLTPGAQVVPYGAAGFVRAVTAMLRDRRDVRLLLYRRVEGLQRPRLRPHLLDGIPACEVALDFDAPLGLLRKAFEEAVSTLTVGSRGRPVVYHQSVVTLPMTPDGAGCLVTCHAPFVDAVLDALGPRLAELAFQDGGGKVAALRRLQHAGLRVLRERRDATSIEMSALQLDVLHGYGVPPERCVPATPPVACGACEQGADLLTPAAHAWLSNAGRRTLFFTAAARIDGFKNLEAAADAMVALQRAGQEPALYLAAAAPDEARSRERLLNRLPRSLARWVWTEPRLPPDRLHALFTHAAGRAVFVFPSRYETLGLTPLQALAHRVDVAVPDSPGLVGAVQYTPHAFRYEPKGDGLADKVAELAGEPGRLLAGGQDAVPRPDVFLRVLEREIDDAV